LRQARAIAGLPLVSIHHEALYSAAAVGSLAGPIGQLNHIPAVTWLPPPPPKAVPPPPWIPTWLAPGPPRKGNPPPPPADFVFPKFTHFQSSEWLVADGDQDHPQEYFQTYDGKFGLPMQRSESMGDAWFALDGASRDLQMFSEIFDEVDLRSGVRVARVTIKWFAGVVLPSGWRLQPGFKGGKGPPRPFGTKTVYIQYAADLGPVQRSVAQLVAKRDRDLADLDQRIEASLAQLRSRMLWIGCAALAALWVGGFVVIRLGLAPLSKMSEAVSKVSPTHLRLSLKTEKLPTELQPIAERLKISLDLLQKAFTREKQAAADISHELRTPLAALMTTLEVALRKSRSTAEYQEILEECHASGQHMYQLVERLLTLARLDAGVDRYHPKSADVTEIALACADLIRPLAKARGLGLHVHVSDPILTETDPDKLRETLTNLLHNAVEYNRPDGSIDLTVEQSNGRVRFEVRDTGIGIKPEEKEHLFERFYRADASRHADTPHAGLGLSIVKTYVDLMGGTIQVESNGNGTTFIVDLPFVPPQLDLATAIAPELELVRR
jgi:heavy metal sensor kinase